MCGVHTFFIKAVDVVGNVSVNDSSIEIDLGDPLTTETVDSVDHHAAGFTGTKDDCTVNGGTGDLEADAIGDPFYGPDDEAFYIGDPGDAFYGGGYLEMSYIWTYTPDSEDLPAIMLIELEATGANPRIEYRPYHAGDFWPASMDEDLSDPIWPAGFNWLAWPGSIPADSMQYEFRIVIDGGPTQGVITGLVHKLVRVTFIDYLEDVAISAARTDAGTGSRLQLTEDFVAIKTETFFRGIRTINSIPIELTGANAAHKGVPIKIGSIFLGIERNDSRGRFIIRIIKQQQFHGLRIFRINGKVDPLRING